MLLLQSILSQETIQKLGWTLVHFIWQAAAVALLLAITLRLLRKSSPSLRYIIACLALAMVVLLPVITIGFIPVSTPQPASQIETMPLSTFIPSEPTPPIEITMPDEPAQPESTTPAASVSLIQRANQFFEPALPYIVSGWLIGVFGLSLWHLGGWAQLQRLRRKLVKKVDDTIYSKLDLLSQRLRFKKTVQLLESALVQIPTVVGWLRPVILLPASALTGLTSEQLEAILAHELAHIKRYDYLVNILQTIVEILGFYHPAVWWISHKIRAERENCCDDLAVSISGDRVCYARALTSMEEIRTTRGRLAVAATGGSLFQRIYRLVGKDSTEKTGSSWIPAATAILLILAIVIPTALALSRPETEKLEQKTDSQVEAKKHKAEISGFVEDENGSPIAGAYVTLLNKDLVLLPKPVEIDEIMHLVISGHDRCITDTNGYFEFVELNPGKTDIIVKAQDYRTEIPREITTGTENIRITLGKPSAYMLAGEVVDGKGNPINEVEITLAGESYTTIRTDEKGAFHFAEKFEPTTVHQARALFARKERFGVWGKTLDTTGGETYVKITLLPEEKISGRVVDQIGKPIANATILFWSCFGRDTSFSFSGKWRGIAPRTGTDANGQFTLTGIPTESNVFLCALAPGYALSELYSFKMGEFGSYAVRNKDKGTTIVHGSNREPAEMVEFKLQRAVTLRGTLTYEDSGRPAPALKIFTQSHKESRWAETKTDQAGRFELEGVSPNPCNLLVTPEDSGKYSPPEWTAAAIEFDDLQEGETRDGIRLVLTKGGVIRGKAVDAEGNPLHGIDIAFYSAARPRSSAACQVIYTAKDGSWAYRFPPGEVYVYIRTKISEGSWSRKSYYLHLNDGQEIDNINFELSKAVPENSPYRRKTAQKTVAQVKVKTTESADKLKKLGLAVVMYANDNDNKLPDNLQTLKPYIANEVDYQWFLNHVEFLWKDKTYQPNQPEIPIAYDQTLLGDQPGTSVLFMDAHVEYVKLPRLKELGIAAKAGNLDVLNIKFEPIHQGKNAVHVTVRNKSDKEQLFRIHIYTRSPDYGQKGVGWGTPFFETIPPKETKSARFVYKIQGPVTDSTWLRLSFRNPESVDAWDSRKPFLEKKYISGDLERLQDDAVRVKPASQTQTDAVIRAFKNIQNHIKNKNYKQAWELFTEDYIKADFQRQRDGYKRFEQAMEPTHPLHSAFIWEKENFLKLYPESVFQKDGVLTLTAVLNQQTWKIDFIREKGQWKIDWIGGYTPGILLMQDWQNLLLPKMEKHSTEHFDIYYFKNSTAEKQLDQIAGEKEKGFEEICKFLEKDPDIRIRMVFFEDDSSKQNATGHQGAGWAFGNTIVEIYNEEQKLDPYHETTHILMNPFGSPPALFNEGFAVYTSERLGAHALKNLSGGTSTLYQRSRQLKSKNEWIPLEELITYTEIGSHESRPPVAYAEAASFVKFLVEKYGKTKFLQAYKTLKNSNNEALQQQNIKELEQIYGKSLQQLEKDWEDSFQKSDSQIEAERAFSADKLKWLGLAIALYANEHDDNLPENLKQVKSHIREEQDFDWLLENAEYFGKGKTAQRNAAFIPIAYDKTLIEKTDGTNVLFLDFSARFLKTEQLKELEIDLSKTTILIESHIMEVDEDFWQGYIEDANLAPQINPVSGLIEPGKPEPVSQTFSLILDDPNATSFLKAVKANKDSAILAAPQVMCRENKTAGISIAGGELYYVSGYNEPNKPSDEPKPKIDKVESGVYFSATPELISDKENIKLAFKLEIAKIHDYCERTYLDKYTHMVPVITRVATSTTAVIPSGKTLLIAFQKTREKILMMLVKPTILSPEQAENLMKL